jgi:hypothetical protein
MLKVGELYRGSFGFLFFSIANGGCSNTSLVPTPKAVGLFSSTYRGRRGTAFSSASVIALVVGVIDNGHRYWYYLQHESR